MKPCLNDDKHCRSTNSTRTEWGIRREAPNLRAREAGDRLTSHRLSLGLWRSRQVTGSPGGGAPHVPGYQGGNTGSEGCKRGEQQSTWKFAWEITRIPEPLTRQQRRPLTTELWQPGFPRKPEGPEGLEQEHRCSESCQGNQREPGSGNVCMETCEAGRLPSPVALACS